MTEIIIIDDDYLIRARSGIDSRAFILESKDQTGRNGVGMIPVVLFSCKKYQLFENDDGGKHFV